MHCEKGVFYSFLNLIHVANNLSWCSAAIKLRTHLALRHFSLVKYPALQFSGMCGILTGKLDFEGLCTDHLTASSNLLDHVSSFKFQEPFFSPCEKKQPLSLPLNFPIGYRQGTPHSDWTIRRHVFVRQKWSTTPSSNSYFT